MISAWAPALVYRHRPVLVAAGSRSSFTALEQIGFERGLRAPHPVCRFAERRQAPHRPRTRPVLSAIIAEQKRPGKKLAALSRKQLVAAVPLTQGKLKRRSRGF